MSVTADSKEDLRELYRELILDHAKRPRHFGKLSDATHTAEGINPLCGDKLTIYLRLSEGSIEAIGFEGSGCAISVASASLLTEAVNGKGTDAAIALANQVLGRLTGQCDTDTEEIGKIRALEGVREFPSRVKCATLAWHALGSAIKGEADAVTTE